MKIAARRIAGLVRAMQRSQPDVFPLSVFAATSQRVAAILSADELLELAESGDVYGIGSRKTLKLVRFVSDEAQSRYEETARAVAGGPSRAMPSVDLIRSDRGYCSYVMRRLLDDGRLVLYPGFRRAA